jgi:hypothetical protein
MACLAPALWATGQSASRPAGQSEPLVAVEFRAVTSDAVPVADLKASDVTLKVDGREREIRSFELMSRGARARTQMTLPPPFVTNQIDARRRDTLLIIDNEAIAAGFEGNVQTVVQMYIRNLGATDRIGAATVGGGFNIGLTERHETVRAAVAAMGGGRSDLGSTGGRGAGSDDVACRTLKALGALTSVAETFKPTGPPVTVLFFSGAMSAPATARMSAMGSGATGGTSTTCDVTPDSYQLLRDTAQDSAVDIHVVNATGGTTSAGLEHLAGITGNGLIQPTRDGVRDIEQLIKENALWYRIAFEPEARERNGSRHRVEVRVGRPGVKANTRPTVMVAKPAASKAMAAKDMLRDANTYPDLELRAMASTSRESGSDKVKVVVLLEPAEASAQMKSAAVGLYDTKGKLVAQGSADPATLARTPAPIAVLASPGVYRMRVAAVDASGRAGAVDTEVNVKLTPADSLKLSSLIPGVAEAGSFSPRLTFTSEPLAVGFLEVYGVGKTANLSAVADLAESEDGPSLAQGSARVIGDGSNDRRVVLSGFPIGPFTPGNILMRVVISVDGKPVGRAFQTLRKNDR